MKEAIYYLKQSSRRPSLLFISKLESFGVEESLSDPRVFSLFEHGSKDNVKMVFIAHLDGHIVAGKVEHTESLRIFSEPLLSHKESWRIDSLKWLLDSRDWASCYLKVYLSATVDKPLDRVGITS